MRMSKCMLNEIFTILKHPDPSSHSNINSRRFVDALPSFEEERVRIMHNIRTATSSDSCTRCGSQGSATLGLQI